MWNGRATTRATRAQASLSSGPTQGSLYLQDSTRKLMKVQLPYNLTTAREFIMMAAADKQAVHLTGCDENQCRQFFSSLVEFWKSPSILFNVMPRINLFWCKLDRVCLRLLASLTALGCRIRLGFGTKIVSFHDENDLIKFLTNEQPLLVVVQGEIQTGRVEFEEEVEAAESENDMTKANSSHGDVYNDNDRINKESELENARAVTSAESRRTTRFSPLSNTYVGLRFYDKHCTYNLDELNARALPSAEGTYELLVTGKSWHLCNLMVLALRVPVMQNFFNYEGDVDGTTDEILDELENRPSTSRPLGIIVDRYGPQGELVPHFGNTNRLLDILNEKKLAFMNVYLFEPEQYDLLDKALATIANSLYFGSLRIVVGTQDEEQWLKLVHFLDQLGRIYPRLRNTFQIYFSFDYFLTDHPGRQELFDAKLTRIVQVMRLLTTKDLKNLATIVSTKVFVSKCHDVTTKILPMGVLRKLREFLA